MKVSFFRCDKCGTWRYSSKHLKETRKYKCLKCNHMINLDKVNQIIYNMPNRPHLKSSVLKEIKAKKAKPETKGYVTYKPK